MADFGIFLKNLTNIPAADHEEDGDFLYQLPILDNPDVLNIITVGFYRIQVT